VATIERAIEIAAKAHAGVKDKQGQPYLLHPLRVMMGVEGEEAQIVAVLHDVVEDTPISLDDIRAEDLEFRSLNHSDCPPLLLKNPPVLLFARRSAASLRYILHEATRYGLAANKTHPGSLIGGEN
jgi:hypothetical protein